MSSCTSCGHQLGVGRFCTSCGAPVDAPGPGAVRVTGPADDGDWRTDTAERQPRVPADPRTPPAAAAPPPPPRYPLYADEVEGYDSYGPLRTSDDPADQDDPVTAAAPVSALPGAAAEPDQPDYDDDYDDAHHYDAVVPDEERRSPVLWILVAALVLALVAAGWWFLVRDDGSDGAADAAGRAAQEPSAGAGVEVAGRASVEAPDTAAPNVDVNGAQVSYDASNMLDGVLETTWRARGDVTGMSLTFTLREPTALLRVGLVNGYAKTSVDDQGRSFDWYLGNRRVNAVVWVFDDGTKVRQQLGESRELQMIDVDVTTGTVVLRIVRVSRPGTGSAARNFTAISEVSLVGSQT